MKIDNSLIIAFGVLFLLGLSYFIFGPKLTLQIEPGGKRTPLQKFFKYLPVFAVVCILGVVFFLNRYYSQQASETEKKYQSAQQTLNIVTETTDSASVTDSANLLKLRGKNYQKLAQTLVKLNEVDSLAKKEAFITGKSAVDPKLVQVQLQQTNEQLDKLSLLTPRVYIQISNEAQRKQGKLIENALDSAGFSVPGIENIDGKAKAPAKTQVRYSDADGFDEAQKILDLIKVTIPQLAIQERPTKIPAGKSRPRHYEIWFSR